MTDEARSVGQGGTSADPEAPTLEVLAWPAFHSQNGNPYTRLLCEGMEREANVDIEGFSLLEPVLDRYDVWHVHWPEDFLTYPSALAATTYVAAELILFAWARVWGTKLVWTTHDIDPHESRYPVLERVFWTVFIPMVDGIISLSETARTEVYSRFPQLQSVPSAVIPHGHYRTAYPEPVGKEEARDHLGLPQDADVALYFGRIRPYKNVPFLVEQFREWEAPDARLLVAGNPATAELGDQIRAVAEGDSRVQTMLRFIEEEEIPRFFSAADLVVLPYKTIMHSGSALLALSFNRPVLVPDRGALSELQSRVGSEWVRTYADELTPHELARAMTWAETENRAGVAPVEDFEWPTLARQTVALYRRVLEVHG